MSALDCARAILKYVSDPGVATVLVAIAGAESNFRENAAGDCGGGYWSCNGCQSFGPWQINMPAHYSWLTAMAGTNDPCTLANWLKDYDNNARAAATVFSRQGFCAWTVFETWCEGWPHNGRYRGYLAEAKEAVDAVLGEQPPACPEGTHYDPATGQCISGPVPSWPLWLIPVLAIPFGLAGAGLIFMSRKNLNFNDVKLLVKEKLRRWSHE